jgi:hypothetical protein
MDVLAAQGYMYFPFFMQFLFTLGIVFLFLRVRSLHTGLLLIGFLLPVLGFFVVRKYSMDLLYPIAALLQVIGLFGYVRRLPPRPVAPEA